jgi:hypothetical protein
VEKHCRAGWATDDNTVQVHCKLNTKAYKHTLRMCNTYYFLTVTMIVRKRLDVTLYVHRLSPSLPPVYTFKLLVLKISFFIYSRKKVVLSQTIKSNVFVAVCRNCTLIAGIEKKCFSSLKHPDRHWSPPASTHSMFWGLLTRC